MNEAMQIYPRLQQEQIKVVCKKHITSATDTIDLIDKVTNQEYLEESIYPLILHSLAKKHLQKVFKGYIDSQTLMPFK